MKSIFAAIILSATAVAAQTGIRSVDFKNFTYQPYCVGDAPETVAVKDGEFSRETPQDGWVDRFFFKVLEIAYGDLDSDGREEAAILTVCNTGGTGNFTEAFIYRLQGSKPALASRLAGGDRAYGGFRSLKIDKGLLIVEEYSPGENGGACCPEFILTKRYKLIRSRLVQTGAVTKRDVLPKQRITFARGANSKTITLRIPAGESIGLVLGARRGQKLIVSTDPRFAEVWLNNDAEIKKLESGFEAILSNSGDQVVEVQNITKAFRVITVKVLID